ncbi:hypothetical protein E2C01_051577 [Portunus trituberculatus]|uniref:Uncharacterized protein n=1 Tax=Portunus trituberculatus TaxID=210409 RepID=A0A5B7GJI4_PORTR|nr:hypothetical protein [Portunus trituberculatus]
MSVTEGGVEEPPRPVTFSYNTCQARQCSQSRVIWVNTTPQSHGEYSPALRPRHVGILHPSTSRSPKGKRAY